MKAFRLFMQSSIFWSNKLTWRDQVEFVDVGGQVFDRQTRPQRVGPVADVGANFNSTVAPSYGSDPLAEPVGKSVALGRSWRQTTQPGSSRPKKNVTLAGSYH